MKDEIKYLILDYGKVLADSVTGHWFITPKFYEIVNTNKIDMEKFNNSIKKLSYLISQEMQNEEDEYNAFCKVYYNVLKDIGFSNNIEELSEKIAYDFVYNIEKHILYSDVKDNLERLAKKYKLILLSDNWPCVYKLMKKWNIDTFFDNIYVSSIYNCKKEEKVFFDFPIRDFNIEKNEAIFVDDNIELLKIANEKGLIPILMDRKNETNECEYKVIQSLLEL